MAEIAVMATITLAVMPKIPVVFKHSVHPLSRVFYFFEFKS